MNPNVVAIGITGASGTVYGLRLMAALLEAGREVHLVITNPGRLVMALEDNLNLPAQPSAMAHKLQTHFGETAGTLRVFGEQDWRAPMASGSSCPAAMVICPCTMATLAAAATGASRNLLERAADVVLKERRTLILVPRETPLSAIHLEHMLRLARLGVVILPPSPGFYQPPTTVSGLVDFVIARILDQLGVEHTLGPRWS